VINAGLPKIADVAAAARLPTIALFPSFAQVGGLMAYGPQPWSSIDRKGE